MKETPKCPHGCDAPQEAGTTFNQFRRIPGHKTKQGGFVMGCYKNIPVRWWTCMKCNKIYQVDEPLVKKKPIVKGKKRGRKPQKRKKRTANKT